MAIIKTPQKNNHKLFNNLQAGVTLVEMVVVVGIIALISSVIIFNFSDFSSNTSIRNLTQEVALSVRKAQTYATSVRLIEGSNGLNSRAFPGYGVTFNLSDPNNTDENFADSGRFVLFADVPEISGTPSSGIYTQTSGEDCGNPSSFEIECIETFSITTSDKITNLCAYISGNEICSTEGVLNITYHRPSPDAQILFKSSASSQYFNASYGRIWVQSLKGLSRSVTVYNTGQISAE